VLVGDAAKVPLVAFAPLHPPEPVHEVALVEDQVTVETLPEVMLVGLAEIATVGGGVGEGLPPAGYALFDPGKTGTPPGTSTSTMFTFDTSVLSFWMSVPISTTFVPATRSVIGMVSGYVRHEPVPKALPSVARVSFAGYGYGTVYAWPFTFTITLFGTLPKYVFQLNKTRTAAACGFAGILSTFQLEVWLPGENLPRSTVLVAASTWPTSKAS
jgi:hypothetical protein